MKRLTMPFLFALGTLLASGISIAWAELSIEDRGDGIEVSWYVGEVADDKSSSSHDLGEGTLVAPGTFTLKATYVLYRIRVRYFCSMLNSAV